MCTYNDKTKTGFREIYHGDNSGYSPNLWSNRCTSNSKTSYLAIQNHWRNVQGNQLNTVIQWNPHLQFLDLKFCIIRSSSLIPSHLFYCENFLLFRFYLVCSSNQYFAHVRLVTKHSATCLHTCIGIHISQGYITIWGARRSAVGWGTALQVGRSRVRFPMVSHNPSGRRGVDPASNRNEYQEYFLGSKDGRCVGVTTLPPSCADCLEIWRHQLPGIWIALPFFYNHLKCLLLICRREIIILRAIHTDTNYFTVN